MARRKISDKGNSKLSTRLARPEPKGIKYGRSYEMHRKPLQLSLYDIVGFLAEDYKEKITLTIGTEEERRLGVTLLSIKRVDFALRELLYIQSYQNGNTKEFTGLAKGGKLTDGTLTPTELIEGKEYKCAEIKVQLSEIAKRAFGSSSYTNRQITEITLRAMQVGLTFRNIYGDEKRRALLWLKGYDYDSRTKAKVYNIVLTAIYSKDIRDNFALHKNGVLNMIGRVTDEKVELLSLLGMQDKRKPFVAHLYKLLEKLGLEDEYKKNKKRVLKRLEGDFKSMVDCGIITQLPKAEQDLKGNVIKYTFLLNPDYGK